MLWKSRASFVGTSVEGKCPKFLAMNHEAINKEGLGKKAIPHKFTLLRATSPGFGSAPYKNKSTTRNPDAKPLAEVSYENTDGRPMTVMKMYTYPKVGMYDKGPRSELSWTLAPGNTIKLWLDEERVTNDATLLAVSIPAFTLCEISVAPKTEESVKKGWCFKITSVRPADFSLHSMTTDLQFLSPSLGEARTREMQAKAAQPLLEKELETQSVAFWTRVRKGASLDDSEGTVKLVNWGEPFPVELPTATLLYATNCKRVDWACALLEVALAAEAVSVLVFANDFWKGGPKAVPIVDTTILLIALESTKVDVDGEEFRVEVDVGPEAVPVAGAAPPASDDFALAGLDTELAAAHHVQFNLRSESGKTIPAVWKGYYNAGPTRTQPVFVKRKRMHTMEDF